MFGPRAVRSLTLPLSVVVVLACGDYTRSTSPPDPAVRLGPPTLRVGASFALVASGAKAKAVKWGPAHSRVEQSVSAVVGAEGGTLSLPGADFSMTIPGGALTAPITITIVAKAGRHVAYEMLPHGLKFLKPVTVVQGLRTTATYGTDESKAVRTAYLTEGNDQINADDSASPVELEASTTLLYGAQPIAETHIWNLNHFSRYLLISGVWTWVNG